MEGLLEGKTGGDPMSGVKWVRCSLRYLSGELRGEGHPACPTTVGSLLEERGYSLQANVKRFTGPPDPRRDSQFEHIEAERKRFRESGCPEISVDGKKKELIGNFKNAGQAWCREPEEVNAHDFPQDAEGRAVPYGIYDVRHNRGYVCVGASADTPEFAVDRIVSWWKTRGCQAYPEAKELLILCDAGGSNGYRCRLWKQQLQEQLVDAFDVTVTVCHYPAGASQWNPIEHRLFSHISINWAGKPLRTFETMLGYIRGTRTQTGLEVEATFVDKVYQPGVKVSDKAMRTLNMVRHSVWPEWNYTLKPRTPGLGAKMVPS